MVDLEETGAPLELHLELHRRIRLARIVSAYGTDWKVRFHFQPCAAGHRVALKSTMTCAGAQEAGEPLVLIVMIFMNMNLPNSGQKYAAE